MGIVKTRVKTLVEDSTISPEPPEPHITDDIKLQQPSHSSNGGQASSGSVPEENQENGIRVSINGKEDDIGDDGIDSGIVKVAMTRVVETTDVSVERVFDGRDVEFSVAGNGGFDDFEIRGASSLIKMRESGKEDEVQPVAESENSEKLSSVLVIEKTTTDTNTLGISDGNEVDVEGKTDEEMVEDEEDGDEKIETITVPIADTSDNKDEEEEDLDEEGIAFLVGDFVWGKIKSHPWWPGQIHNPSDASEYAMKLKQNNRLLVAYFGDGTFAWCRPSQLKPFEENFVEMSKQSNSKSFLNAVGNALDEFGRLVELKMICNCVPKENRIGLGGRMVVNAGIKEGDHVPEIRAETISTVLLKTAGILNELKDIAQTISVTSLLELRLLRSELSAFFRAKGGYQLPDYQEPSPIPGLADPGLADDLDSGSIDESKFENAFNLPIQGPGEEDWLSSPVNPTFGQSHKSMLRNCQVMSGDRLYQRRKQKSIAEIMDADVTTVVRDDDNSTPTEDKKRKAKPLGSPSHENGENGSKEVSKKRFYSGGRKKSEAARAENDVSGEKVETKKNSVSVKRKLSIDNGESDEGEIKEQNGNGSFSRERKKSKYLSPPFTSISRLQRKKDTEAESVKVSKEARLGERMTKAASNLTGSPLSLNRSTETFPEDENWKHEKVEKSDPQTPKQDENKVIDLKKVKASPGRVLSELRSVALNPLYQSKIKLIEGFMGIFRSSIYHDGSHYEAFEKFQSGRKRKNIKAEKRKSVSKDQNQRAEPISKEKNIKRGKSDEPISDEKMIKKRKLDEPKAKRSGGRADAAKSSEKKSKKANGTANAKTGSNRTEKAISPASLFMTFGPGSFLPTKADLIRTYCKFGPLDETETEMFSTSFCARVVFLKSSDAEEAFNSSQNASPFESSNVTFRLRCSESSSKTRGLSELPQQEASAPTKSRTKTLKLLSAQLSPIQFIREKLKTMMTMLEDSDGKVWSELKSKLQGEMKGLLEKVNTMVEFSS